MRILGFGNKSSSKRVSLDVPTENEEVLVILNWKALVALFVDMAQPAGVILSMKTHRMRAANQAENGGP